MTFLPNPRRLRIAEPPSNLTFRRPGPKTIYDREDEIDSVAAATAVAVLAGMRRSPLFGSVVTAQSDPAIVHMLDGVLAAADVLRSAVRSGRVVIVADVPVDRRHPSYIDPDPAPPFGMERPS